MTGIDWYKPCAYDDAQKHIFHSTGRKRLKALAAALGFEPDSFEVRSNQGGIAVSGEVTLHQAPFMCRSASPRPAGTAAS